MAERVRASVQQCCERWKPALGCRVAEGNFFAIARRDLLDLGGTNNVNGRKIRDFFLVGESRSIPALPLGEEPSCFVFLKYIVKEGASKNVRCPVPEKLRSRNKSYFRISWRRAHTKSGRQVIRG